MKVKNVLATNQVIEMKTATCLTRRKTNQQDNLGRNSHHGNPLQAMPNREMPKQLLHGNPVEDIPGPEIPEEFRRQGFDHDNGGQR